MIEGKELMIALENGNKFQTIAMARNCAMNLSTQLSDSQTKDDNEKSPTQEVSGMSWELTTENLVPVSQDEVVSVEHIVGLLTNGTPVRVRFSIMSGSLGKDTGEAHDWIPKSTEQIVLSGTTQVSSISINGNNKEKTTMSATFKGKGKPTVGS